MAGVKIERIAIVGARGQMGALFARTFHKAGYTVATLDRPYAEEAIREAVAAADLVLISVPVTATKDVARTLAPHMKAGAILCDVCSVKVNPLEQMLAAYDGPVVGTHPLFGPVIPEGFDPRVAVTPGRDFPDGRTGAAEAVSEVFARSGFSPFASTAEEHDRAMAVVQGLNFITTTAYLAAARQTPAIEKFRTPSFERRLEAARKMLTQDRELFQLISEDNPFLQETVRQFTAYLDLAAGGDLDLLSARASWWWRDTA
ncbi:MAG TPA: prephenate dehydrogenase/arogenate dehydrogenase family protein [Humidesulfovibrio sp.]|uniref:prephenate dehydrogenase/arogenate dehydrogenase family protein n=1 Tax=Humidesulfovibrio sp. TaxID=2910988 RepID=UPI002CC54E68|nr:prephenate dehydrogenase/arogenate dehydrogenase family protein [Humidesulfovibrio sp.]HWR03131.1 prephenate dehydrogenase/arogenate dehydrogenase family protein [Humidesulfovibrio sp.]